MVNEDKASLKNLFRELLYVLVLLAAATIVVNIIDTVLLGRVWSGVSRPNFETAYILRTIIIAVIGLIFVLFVIRHNRVPEIVALSNSEPPSNSLWPWVTLSENKRKIGLVSVIVFSFLYLVVFFYDPIQFRDLSSDEKLVENLSAIFSFIAFIVFFFTGFVFFKIRKKDVVYAYSAIIGWFFSLLFFVICMEEIAWMQGVLFFDTPDIFMGNSQGETNFHNYATYRFELSYYFSTFLFFIALPFYYDHRSVITRVPVFKFFLPSRFMLYIGAMAAAYNYDMWNNLYFQLCFFITLYILIYYIWLKRADKSLILLSILIALFFFSQSSFVLFGIRVERTPSFKEYKEFFIPLTFLFYSFEIYLRAKKQARILDHH